MPTYGYLAYLIRLAPPHRERNLQRLSSVGDARIDFLTELRRELDDLGTSFHRNANKAEGFRVRTADPYGRSIFVRLRRGPVGNPGETYDVESDTSVETGDTTALLSELRAAFFIPADSYFGFMFVERIGGRHVKDLMYQRVLVPVAKRINMLVRVEAFAETDDWRKELAGQQVLRVTEVLKGTSSADDQSTVDDLTVHVSAEGSQLGAMSEQIKARVFDVLDRRHSEYRVLADIAPLEARRKVWADVNKRDGTRERKLKAAPRSVFTVADADELDALALELQRLKNGEHSDELLEELQSVLPVDRDEFESRRLEVSLGTERPEKTFVVEGDKVPQLVYPLQSRLLDVELQRAWEAHVEGFLARLNVSTPTDWLLN